MAYLDYCKDSGLHLEKLKDNYYKISDFDIKRHKESGIKNYVHAGNIISEKRLPHIEIEPFRDLYFMKHFVTIHSFDYMYFNFSIEGYENKPKGVHLESKAFMDFPIKELYRWYFPDGLPEDLQKFIPFEIYNLYQMGFNPVLKHNISLPPLFGKPNETSSINGVKIYEIVSPIIVPLNCSHDEIIIKLTKEFR